MPFLDTDKDPTTALGNFYTNLHVCFNRDLSESYRGKEALSPNFITTAFFISRQTLGWLWSIMTKGRMEETGR